MFADVLYHSLVVQHLFLGSNVLGLLQGRADPVDGSAHHVRCITQIFLAAFMAACLRQAERS